MPRPLVPVLNTILFTILVPGTVLGYIPYRFTGGFAGQANGPLGWLGAVVITLGAAVYFRCAWEFAVRGLGTPAPIAPTKYLVTTALHRYVRNPMYIGVFLVLAGEAILFRSLHLVEYMAFFCVVDRKRRLVAEIKALGLEPSICAAQLCCLVQDRRPPHSPPPTVKPSGDRPACLRTLALPSCAESWCAMATTSPPIQSGD